MAKRITDKKRIGGTWTQQEFRRQLTLKSYEYLNNNFHKFNQDKKIQVALAIIGKDMATKLEHSGKVSIIDALKQLDLPLTSVTNTPDCVTTP